MPTETTTPLVHSYDTQQHRVLCGVREHTNSTKHTAAVTCPTCLRMLEQGTADRDAAAGA
jgi:hypothetical protein